MSYVLAGATSGLFMASVFVAIGPVMLFILAKDPPPALHSVLVRVPPMTMMMGMLVLAYPTWAVIGIALGLLYRASSSEAAAGGLGSPNLGFTAAVIAAAIILSLPPAVLLRRVLAGVAAMALTFAGVFGWLLPFLAR